MPYFTHTRRPCDLEPVETTETPAPDEQPGTARRGRTQARERLERQLAARPGFWRLTPAEQREHTEDRTHRVEALIAEHGRAADAHCAHDPVTLADSVARTWGLSDDDRKALRPFAERAVSAGLDRALESLDASSQIDDRLRCAIALVLQTAFGP